MSTDPPTVETLPRLLTEKQAADALGVSTSTLRRESKQKRIGYIMIAGRRRYLERHLTSYVSAREVEPCTEGKNQSAPAKSGATGSVGATTANPGAERGSTL